MTYVVALGNLWKRFYKEINHKICVKNIGSRQILKNGSSFVYNMYVVKAISVTDIVN